MKKLKIPDSNDNKLKHFCLSHYDEAFYIFQAGIIDPFIVPVNLFVRRVHGSKIASTADSPGYDQSSV